MKDFSEKAKQDFWNECDDFNDFYPRFVEITEDDIVDELNDTFPEKLVEEMKPICINSIKNNCKDCKNCDFLDHCLAAGFTWFTDYYTVVNKD